jgi:hypothetical protein
VPNPGDDGTSPWTGVTLDGRYHIRELLGEGGMGAVYVAEHLSLRKQVALKVIHPEFAGNEEIAARFTREAMATAQLDHPNVASALDYGTLPNGGAYLVTQLVRGRSLESHRAAGQMAWRQVCDAGAQIADALAAAHAIGIVHRDLKPDNILLEPRDDGSFLVKVLDFGVARITAGANLPTSDLTRMGTVIGTPGYMAPEQAMGESVDFRVDIYALGVILWECMAGRVLWDGESVSDLFTRQLAGPAPPLAAEAPSLPPELCALVDLMLDRNPKRRPESARQIRDALRRMAHGTLILPPTAKATPAPVKHSLPRWVVPVGIAVLLLAGVLALIDTEGEPPEIDDTVEAEAGAEPEVAAEPEAKTKPGTRAVTPPVRKGRVDPPASELGELPAGMAEHVQVLLSQTDRKARKAASDALLAFEPQDSLALYARNIAWLERAAGCDAKKAVIKKIAEAGDKRPLGALKILARTPKKGCGLFKTNDCYECMRETLAKTIGQLEGA